MKKLSQLQAWLYHPMHAAAIAAALAIVCAVVAVVALASFGLYGPASICAVLALAALGSAAWSLRVQAESRQAMRDALSNAEAVKARFLSVASHDMRQPLHAFSLYLSALERRVQADDARDILAKMEGAAESMVAMFAGLSELARVQGRGVEPDVTHVVLQDVIDRVVAKHPEGSIEAPATEVVLRTDSLLFERAISALVSNALSHGGGRAGITVELLGDQCALTVSDDGPGIALADQGRIFDEFVRLNGHAGEGLGLGLAVVKRIAVLLNMPLEVSSAPGEGARFTLRAPLGAPAVAPFSAVG